MKILNTINDKDLLGLQCKKRLKNTYNSLYYRINWCNVPETDIIDNFIFVLKLSSKNANSALTNSDVSKRKSHFTLIFFKRIQNFERIITIQRVADIYYSPVIKNSWVKSSFDSTVSNFGFD